MSSCKIQESKKTGMMEVFKAIKETDPTGKGARIASNFASAAKDAASGATMTIYFGGMSRHGRQFWR